MTDQPVVALRRVSRTFGTVKAVDGVSLDVRRGEFFSLLGPSGCGKTTTLRLIAGLERPDADGGEVRLLGEVVNDRRPYERPVAMVFQSYALFPHLSVERNVAFGLEERRLPRADIARRVGRALDLVRLDPGTFARRRPSQLSGGQRQRVALARALVLEPAILLLDEPLGALDLQLRKAMQLELRTLNRELGITFVFVTHDQEEALTMSDRIAVMDQARVAQVGTPAEIYEAPRTAFVAGFIGECNILERRTGGTLERVAIRPEWLDLYAPGAVPPNEQSADGTVEEVIYLGETLHVLVRLADGTATRVALRNEGQLQKPLPWRRGDRVAVAWLPEDAAVLEDG
jgi:ABC-type Fe3+/spermidine/putrescine transport system ATPase subunit